MTNEELTVLMNASLDDLNGLDLPTTLADPPSSNQRQTIQVMADLARMAADCLYMIRSRG